MDLSPDGSRLYVAGGCAKQEWMYPEGGFAVVDTAKLSVIDFLKPTFAEDPRHILTQYDLLHSGPVDYSRGVASMKNGKIFITPGFTDPVWSYQPSTGIATPDYPEGYNTWALLVKSSDGSRFLYRVMKKIWLYDSALDSYVAQIPNPGAEGTSLAISADGSRILLRGHILLDQSLTEIGKLDTRATLSDGQQFQCASFSPDGSRIYVVIDIFEFEGASKAVIGVFDARSRARLGYVVDPRPSSQRRFDSPFVVGDGAVAAMLGNRGVYFADVSAPNPNLGSGPLQMDASVNISPSTGVAADGRVDVNAGHLREGTKVFFDASPSRNEVYTPSSNSFSMRVTPPPRVEGPTDVTVAYPDGWAVYGPEVYHAGPTILAQFINAGPTEGGTEVELFGYGFAQQFLQTPSPRVYVGGIEAKLVSLTLNDLVFPLHTLRFAVPPGAPGTVDIRIEAYTGTATIKDGFRYVQHHVVPGIDAIELLLDESRNRLYVADLETDSVLAVDLATLKVSTLFAEKNEFPEMLSLTPDNKRLLVLSSLTGNLLVIDLDSGQLVNRHQLRIVSPEHATCGYVPNALIATARNSAMVSYFALCTLTGGTVKEVDLSSGVASDVPGWWAADIRQRTIFSADRERSVIFMGPDASGETLEDAQLGTWYSSLGAYVPWRKNYFAPYTLSSSASGSQILSGWYVYDHSWAIGSALAVDDYTAGRSRYIRSPQMHYSGAMAYVPMRKGIDLHEVHRGRRLLTIGIPKELTLNLNGLAVDSSGRRIFAAENGGIGVVELDKAPLAIGNLSPNKGAAAGGNVVVIEGIGFEPGVEVSIDGNTIQAEVEDSTRLRFRMPAVGAQKHAVTLTNPDGESYRLDLAYDASPEKEVPPPALTRVFAASAPETDYCAGIRIVEGSGFVPGATAHINGTPVRSTYLSPTKIGAYLTHLPTPGRFEVTVRNPGTGAKSNPVFGECTKNAPTPVYL